MKRRMLYVLGLSLIFTLSSCSDMLEQQPLDKTTGEKLLESSNGIRTLLARLYNQMPIEDFIYRPFNPAGNGGFNTRGFNGIAGTATMTSMYTDEATRSAGTGIGPVSDSYWPYDDIREVNMFLENLEEVKGEQISEDEYLRLKSEAHFIRAYMYFGLAKRYGGVPLIKEVLDDEYDPSSDNASLNIPRSTEKATWKFILNECDLAVKNLPANITTQDGKNRATKWAAYGLKSRVALFAASVAKYWKKAPLVGEAVNQKLVGMSPSDAAFFYKECISASEAILNKSGKSLYKPNPSTPQEAASNFYDLFFTDNNEIIFKEVFAPGSKVPGQGHSYDVMFNPSQTQPGFHKWGRFSPTLDLVDLFEDYSNNGTRESAKIDTRDGNEDYVIPDPTKVNINLSFKKYGDLYEPFKNKDARLLASVIVPGSEFKGEKIVSQGGLIKPDGSKLIYTNGSAEGKDGKTYYTYGAIGPTNYSAFANLGQFTKANFSNSGFFVKKYLQMQDVAGETESSGTDWIDMRLAEIYLNYAESVAESGRGNESKAADLINDLRRRAGHTDEIPLTIDNVLKERRVELAFEGFRYWDLVRRREFHELFDNTRRKVLVPLLDLRENPPQYIFVRANNYYDENAGGRTFQPYMYYEPIPGRATNDLVENPKH